MECTDLDGDDRGVGPDCLGTDCDDTDAQCWEGVCCPADCVDQDGDGYGVGAGCLGSDCDDGDDACVAGACCHPGQASCGEVLTCWAACSDTTCADACVAFGDSVAQALFDELQLCDQTTLCSGDPSCWQTQCGPELTACQSDG